MPDLSLGDTGDLNIDSMSNCEQHGTCALGVDLFPGREETGEGHSVRGNGEGRARASVGPRGPTLLPAVCPAESTRPGCPSSQSRRWALALHLLGTM